MHPICEGLCVTYNYLYNKGEVAFPLNEENLIKLDTIAKTVQSSWFGVEHFDSLKKKISAYFYFIIKDHPVIDGNKRLAVLWIQTLSITTETEFRLAKDWTLDSLAVAVEKTTLSEEETIEVIEAILFSPITF